MSVAPEPFHTACMEVMYRATLEARAMAWGKWIRDEQIADLMDAIHNIPHLVNDWERCDPKVLRDYLARYDAKWAAEGGCQLAVVYDEWVGRDSGKA